MTKYFIRPCNANGSLAVEKHLSQYICDNYSNTVVSEEALERVVADIRKQQDLFLQAHNGAKPVKVECITSPSGSGQKYLDVGSLVINIIRVRREIY